MFLFSNRARQGQKKLSFVTNQPTSILALVLAVFTTAISLFLLSLQKLFDLLTLFKITNRRRYSTGLIYTRLKTIFFDTYKLAFKYIDQYVTFPIFYIPYVLASLIVLDIENHLDSPDSVGSNSLRDKHNEGEHPYLSLLSSRALFSVYIKLYENREEGA